MAKPFAFELDIMIDDPAVEGRVDTDWLSGFWMDFANHALIAEGAAGKWSVAFVLTSDVGLQRLHLEFMGLDTPTDIMTFPVGEMPGLDSMGGDIIVSVDRAAEQGAENGNTLDEELLFLLAHGLLHLTGWDDATTDGRANMLARQSDLIRGFQNRG